MIISTPLKLMMMASVGLVPALVFGQVPQSAKTSGPPTSAAYQSAFEGYQPFVDSEMKPWRSANEEIAKTDYMGGMSGTQSKGAVPDTNALTAPVKSAPEQPMAPMGSMRAEGAKPARPAVTSPPTKPDPAQ